MTPRPSLTRAARFRVGQVVMCDNEPVLIKRIGGVFEDEREYVVTGWRFPKGESELRPLTKRERGQ